MARCTLGSQTISCGVFLSTRKSAAGFTKKYNVDRLVWFEAHDDVNVAIRREKEIKKWRRDWKIELIEADNPDWLDALEVNHQVDRLSFRGTPQA
jgi:hypothetical protein